MFNSHLETCEAAVRVLPIFYWFTYLCLTLFTYRLFTESVSGIQTFSEKDQMVNLLGFLGHVVAITLFSSSAVV